MLIATLLQFIFKTPAVYIHSFNRDLPEELVGKQLGWRWIGNLQPQFITAICLIVAFHTVGIQLPGLGEPLHFHWSLTTSLQGKQKLTNQKFAHVNPQENILKGQSHCISMLIHITIAASQKTKPIQIHLYKISLRIHLLVHV